MANFSRPTKIFVDPIANEAYVADGYGNRRVVVIDADTGEFKRYWGAYGDVPDEDAAVRYDPDGPPAKQFGDTSSKAVHCAELSHDRVLLYVCDRKNNRIQVFRPDGKFVDEMFIEKATLGSGAVWDIAFSRDADQTYLFVADGTNEKVYIVERKTLDLISSFGDGGRQPGQFYGTHSIAADSHGNLYTTETFEGKRLQKFVHTGMGTIRSPHQGVLWPTRGALTRLLMEERRPVVGLNMDGPGLADRDIATERCRGDKIGDRPRRSASCRSRATPRLWTDTRQR